MHFIQGIWYHKLYTMHFTLWMSNYAFNTMRFTQWISHYESYTTNLTHWISHHANYTISFTLCTSNNVLDFIKVNLYIYHYGRWFFSQNIFNCVFGGGICCIGSGSGVVFFFLSTNATTATSTTTTKTNDIPIHNNCIPSEKLKSQEYLDEINMWIMKQKFPINQKKTKTIILNFTYNYQFATRLSLNQENIEVWQKQSC